MEDDVLGVPCYREGAWYHVPKSSLPLPRMTSVTAAAPLRLARETQAWKVGAPGMAWNEALRYIAGVRDPASLPSDVLVEADESTYTIYDGYPKAQYHFLVMPRLPLELPPAPDSTRAVTVPADALDSLRALLASAWARPVLERLAAASRRVRRRADAAHGAHRGLHAANAACGGWPQRRLRA